MGLGYLPPAASLPHCLLPQQIAALCRAVHLTTIVATTTVEHDLADHATRLRSFQAMLAAAPAAGTAARVDRPGYRAMARYRCSQWRAAEDVLLGTILFSQTLPARQQRLGVDPAGLGYLGATSSSAV